VNRQLTWRRRLADKLLSLSARLLPAEQASWAAVMRSEVQHIEEDGEALSWALGSVRAGMAERLRVLQLQRLLSAHSAGILWIVIFTVSSTFDLGIALAARLGDERMASALGYWLKGFRYDRFHALAAAMPVGLYVLMGLVGLLFAVSLYLNLTNRAAAFNTFCCALALRFAAWLYQLGIPAYAQAISSQRRLRIGICFLLTAAILSALRLGRDTPHSSIHRLHKGQP
jgi:hypothetical protein